jgi:hypothetical protein
MSACVQCGQNFSCGMVDTPASDPCWCMALPPLPPALLESVGDARAVSVQIVCKAYSIAT